MRVKLKTKTKTKTKSPPSRTRTRKSKLNLYKRKQQKQKQEEEVKKEEEDEAETNSNNNNDVVVTVAVETTAGNKSREDTGPFSLRWKFPNNFSANSNLNQLASTTCEHYAKMAESLKKLIVLELSSWSGDVETMVASVNKAFKTLDWLQPEDTKFYDTIRAVHSGRTQISSVDSKLRTHQSEESDTVFSIQARLKEAVARSKADYWKAIEWVSGLKSRVSEIREVLKKLEHESAWEQWRL